VAKDKNPRPKLALGDVERAIGQLESWAENCHGAAIALVQTGLVPGSRVARGFARGVGHQHSWVVVPTQFGVYDMSNWVVDITLWSYVPEASRLYVGKASHWPHVPHGQGHLRLMGRDPEGPRISLAVPLSRAAQSFLQMYAPAGLDYQGWMQLFNGHMQGWPAQEIVQAAYLTKEVKPAVPLDIVGMLTDLNPGGLYLAGDKEG
jgi:hypothetical protein